MISVKFQIPLWLVLAAGLQIQETSVLTNIQGLQILQQKDPIITSEPGNKT